VATILDKELKRRITVDGAEYTVAIDPAGFRLVGKGKRTLRSSCAGVSY
jgi:hypothetical protein